MNNALKNALLNRLIGMADDELILSHRNAEWTGHAPLLEEDIALANLAQDELGHATVLLGLVEELNGKTPDQMAYFRDAAEFRNVQFLELPKGDWAFTMLRQYLFDAYETILYNRLLTSSYQPLADVVAKFRGEEIYHLRHSHMWVERLGLGTDESLGRLQAALDQMWPLTAQLFQVSEADNLLSEEGVFPLAADMADEWQEIVLPHLANCSLHVPTHATMLLAGRETHTHFLNDLLTDMQQVARWDPSAEW